MVEPSVSLGPLTPSYGMETEVLRSEAECELVTEKYRENVGNWNNGGS